MYVCARGERSCMCVLGVSILPRSTIAVTYGRSGVFSGHSCFLHQ